MIYEVSVAYKKMNENGLEVSVKEVFLVQAISFAEAEQKAMAFGGQLTMSNFDITAIKESAVMDVICNSNGVGFFKVSFNFITIDLNGREKKTKKFVYIESNTLDEAKQLFADSSKNSMTDYEVVGIQETKITEYIID